MNLNQLRFDITAFNTYRDIDLAIETQPLSMSLNVMKLGVFQRTAAAMEYYRAAKALPDLAAHKDIIIFVITEQNFEALMKERYLSGYIDFFKKNMDTP